MASQEPAQSSGSVVADSTISNRPSVLHAVQLIADGTNQATVSIYDSATAASGTLLCKLIVDAGLTYEWFQSDGVGVVCQNGIFADLAGTGAEVIVHFRKI